MNSVKLALIAAAIAATPTAAFAQDVGETIFGNDGNPIGTVDKVFPPDESQGIEKIVVINTGKHKAPVPANLLYKAEAGQTVNATKGQIEAMMDQQVAEAAAKLDAALVVNAAVLSVNGNPAGTLTSVDTVKDAFILESPEGSVLLRKEHFKMSPEGQLMTLYTRDQIATTATAPAPAGGAQ